MYSVLTATFLVVVVLIFSEAAGFKALMQKVISFMSPKKACVFFASLTVSFFLCVLEFAVCVHKGGGE